MENERQKLLESEVKLCKAKIETADDVMENGTLEQKMNFIISDIKSREQNKLLGFKHKEKLLELSRLLGNEVRL